MAREELAAPGAPRVYSLTKIVEISHFNMSRIRCEHPLMQSRSAVRIEKHDFMVAGRQQLSQLSARRILPAAHSSLRCNPLCATTSLLCSSASWFVVHFHRRLVWSRIWAVLADFFVEVGCHPNLQVRACWRLRSCDGLRRHLCHQPWRACRAPLSGTMALLFCGPSCAMALSNYLHAICCLLQTRHQ